MTAKVRVRYKLWLEILDLFVVCWVSHVHVLCREVLIVQAELLYGCRTLLNYFLECT